MSPSIDENAWVCANCVGDKHLQTFLRKSIQCRTCAYCGNDNGGASLLELCNLVKAAFDRHYRQNSELDDGYEDLEETEPRLPSEKRGTPSGIAIAEATGTGDNIASDIQYLLHRRLWRKDLEECGIVQQFAEDSYYSKRTAVGAPFHRRWSDLEARVKYRSRYFDPKVKEILDSIFQELVHPTPSRHSPILNAGPMTKISGLYRARTFNDEDKLRDALKAADRELGPPPVARASPGRMNARGVSVFYGAQSAAVALAEVRPPVGSFVVTCRFAIIRKIKLLDLNALRSRRVKGSVFDPLFLERLERVAFLRTFGSKISQAVLPGEEGDGYLITQVVADYLATVAGVDGLIFDSAQSGTRSSNVVLFNPSSRTEYLKHGDGIQISVRTECSVDEESSMRFFVQTLVHPPSNGKCKYRVLADGREFNPFSGTRGDDPRVPTLRLETSSLTVNYVKSSRFNVTSHEVVQERIEADPDQGCPPL